MTKIRKAIIPIGYLVNHHGINVLPTAKTLSNEMLTIVDRPLIQYTINEALSAGIEEFIFVVNGNETAVEEYLSQTDLPQTKKVIFIRQLCKQELANKQNIAHAILLTRDIIGDEPFALLLPKIIIQSQTACLTQLIKAQEENNDSFKCVFGVQEITNKKVKQHQITAHKINKNNQYKVTNLIEKTDKEKNPTNLTIAGRYILPPEIFEIISEQKSNKKLKLDLTKAMQKLLDITPIMAVKFNGTFFDCQTKTGHITANLSFAIERSDIKEELIGEFIRTRLRLKVDNLLDENAIIEMARVLKATTSR